MILQFATRIYVTHLMSPVDGVTVCGRDADRVTTVARYGRLHHSRRWCLRCEAMR